MINILIYRLRNSIHTYTEMRYIRYYLHHTRNIHESELIIINKYSCLRY